MAERNITSVDLLESVTNKTNAIVEENGTLNKVNLHNEFNTINTKIDNEVNTLSNNIAQLSNPNLLINSDFRTCGMTCVNQRGQSNYNGHWENTTYTIDRWKIAGGSNQMSMKVNSYSITLTSNTTTYQWFGQQLEHALTPGTYTFTISVKSMTCATYLTLNDKFYDLHEGKNVITDEFGSGIDGFWIITHAVGTIELEYIKLEAGSVSTPLVPRSYAEELALCQRYYMKLKNHNGDANIFMPAVQRNDTTAYAIVSIPVAMRTTPTCKLEGQYMFTGPSGTWIGVTAYSITTVTDNTITILTTLANSTTMGTIVALLIQSTVGGYIEFDAEIY